MLKKLFSYFSKDKKKIPDKYSIIISLTSNYDIDIQLLYPNLQEADLNSIPDIAEKYANLLVYSSTNVLQSKLLDIVFDQSDNLKNSIKEKLFFDNIISFYTVLKQQIKLNKTRHNPLIRPINVFSIK